MKILNVCLVAAGLVLAGCATPQLDPSGVYAGQTWLYRADQAADDAFAVLDAFENWELQNHGYIVSNTPAVFLLSESIRTNAPKWFAGYQLAWSNCFYLVSQVPVPAQQLTAASNTLSANLNCLQAGAGAAGNLMTNSLSQ